MQYRNVLDQLDEELGEDFPLWDVIERFDNEQKLPEELTAHKTARRSGKNKGRRRQKRRPTAAETQAARSPARHSESRLAERSDSQAAICRA